MTLDSTRFTYAHPLQVNEEVFHVRDMIPYDEKEQMAQDYVSAALVFDEEAGIAYEGYNADQIRAFLILAHYTDLDLTGYDNPQGRYAIYDMIASHGLWEAIHGIVHSDLTAVDRISALLIASARRSFECKHSLQYRIGKVFDNLLGTENLTETVAKAEGLNSKLIDMLGALGREKAAKPSIGGNIMQFAKKD